MTRNILMGLTLCAAVALVVWSCDSQPEVPLQPPGVLPPGQVPPPMTPPGMPPAPGLQPPGIQPPVAPPVAPPTPVAEAPLPRTELIPISEEVDEPEPKKIVKGGTGICKLPGPETPGDELLGNYECAFKVKGLPFGLSPPPVSCSIRKKSDGTLKVKRSGGEAGSFGGPITYDRAKRLHRLIRGLPLESILLETDAPDQPDSQHRGERNEPAYLPIVLEAVSRLRNQPAELIASQTTQNCRELFNLP